ncbi:PREDICTED: uncharacterized protein LOC105559928 [Vollenhovia emeryi]|uniref:uncharacterized protein LOC105559928 n=1 Tax=Vollenhovia emeryi TaxID=411798 RepID=UPI0005F52146|nr:PREDICTED: uncharacterized protein LOC105559928 [Vollenhovia emeryi]
MMENDISSVLSILDASWRCFLYSPFDYYLFLSQKKISFVKMNNIKNHLEGRRKALRGFRRDGRRLLNGVGHVYCNKTLPFWKLLMDIRRICPTFSDRLCSSANFTWRKRSEIVTLRPRSFNESVHVAVE